jgi:hypothetical protein
MLAEVRRFSALFQESYRYACAEGENESAPADQGSAGAQKGGSVRSRR